MSNEALVSFVRRDSRLPVSGVTEGSSAVLPTLIIRLQHPAGAQACSQLSQTGGTVTD